MVDCWVCCGVGSGWCLEGGISVLIRRENAAFQEDLILNHKELFCFNTLLGQKAAWGSLIPAPSFSLDTFSSVIPHCIQGWGILDPVPPCLQQVPGFCIVSSEWDFLQLHKQWHRHLEFSSSPLQGLETGLSICSSLEVPCNYLLVLNKSGFSRDFHCNWISH